MTRPEFVEVPFAVPLGTARMRLDVFLAHRLRGYSRSKVQAMIASERVRLRARSTAPRQTCVAAKPSMKVVAGDAVLIRFPWRPDPPSRHAALEVLYEDADIIAVNKPGDILSHPTDKTTKASATWILDRQFAGFKPRLIHRLDRETSGVLLFGRNPRAARLLSGQFEGREVRKEYWAIAAGRFTARRKVVDQPVGSGGHGIRVRQGVCDAGQSARTEFRLIASGKDASLVAAVPRTGRLHQIRVHLAWLGHPVVGDKLYTGDGEAYLKAWQGSFSEEDLARLGAGRQMLHAKVLELRHPSSRRRLVIEAPLPADFRACMESFGLRPRIRALIPLAAAAFLAACSPVYVVKSASGHLGFVSRARPIGRLIADPKTDVRTREKLELLAEAREFAFKEMGLKRSKDYSKVSRIKGPYVSYVVMASAKTRFKLHEWWFPFVGRVPYKGHFSREDADREALRLARKGLDVHVGGVSAYNTPLPFADPLAHTQLDNPPGELATLVIHELVHGTLFLKDQVDFNEAAATFASVAAAEDFLAARFGSGSAELSEYRASLEKDRLYASEMEKVYAELESLYAAGGLSEAEKLDRRKALLSSGRRHLSRVLGADAGELNNASILAHRLYRHDLTSFHEAHERLGRRWKVTIEFLMSLDRRRPMADLERRLAVLRAGT